MTLSDHIKFDVFLFCFHITMSGEQLKTEKKYWLPNNFQLSAEIINSIVKHPSMTIVTKFIINIRILLLILLRILLLIYPYTSPALPSH